MVRAHIQTLAFGMGLSLTIFAAREAGALGCSKFVTYKDVLVCALENDPDVIRSVYTSEQNELLPSVAAQRPNPEFGTQLLFGKAGEEKYQDSLFSFAHTVELGGKRDARILKARANLKISQSEARLTREQTYLTTFLTLVRLRQIHNELELVDEAIATYGRVQKQFKGRARLNPEQRVLFKVLATASQGYSLQRISLISEFNVFQNAIVRSTLKNFDAAKELLPPVKVDWPSSENIVVNATNSQLDKVKGELEVANADLNIEESLAWPDMKLGPSFQFQTQGAQRTSALGLNLSLPLPVFHRNEAGRAYAEKGIERSNHQVSAVINEQNRQLLLFKQKYRSSVEALKSSTSFSVLELDHKAIEKDFENGGVPSSLFIESHRQVIDLTKEINARELDAYDALGRILELQGRLLEEGL